MKDDHEYLGDKAQGTYQYWSISEDLRAAKEILADWKEQLEQERHEKTDKPGWQVKKEKLRRLGEEFRALRNRILESGGKTFDELHHRSAQKGENQVSSPNVEEDIKHFDPKVNFRLPDLTDRKREAYIRLYEERSSPCRNSTDSGNRFEAAWTGDEATLKELTLGPWGSTGENPALQIAVQDFSGFSPFTIAVIREHHHLAKLVLQITSI